MAKKPSKKKASKEQKLRAALAEVEAELKQSERKRATWKKRATRAEAALADVQGQLRRAETDAGEALDGAEVTPPAAPRADASWTVAQLREEARRRGVGGLSGKPKAELLRALS
ncbi:MAG: hypothetical protein AVDCRST_MAG32-310 [uncultured Nocardioides sp.]|uniref:Rho termination factor N-terminal domain-containing protein n=1 Tax=uncultured Nocardioides sp. TaxID=198441 RepID=A0A6J4MTC8_9ACTN|nr:MAG: hypothetical protein AVDCRST_MAG32-310 [uncultured Nocardioides sp.]